MYPKHITTHSTKMPGTLGTARASILKGDLVPFSTSAQNYIATLLVIKHN